MVVIMMTKEQLRTRRDQYEVLSAYSEMATRALDEGDDEAFMVFGRQYHELLAELDTLR